MGANGSLKLYENSFLAFLSFPAFPASEQIPVLLLLTLRPQNRPYTFRCLYFTGLLHGLCAVLVVIVSAGGVEVSGHHL